MDFSDYAWRTALPNDDGFEVIPPLPQGPWTWIAQALAQLPGTHVTRAVLDLACEQALDDHAPAMLEHLHGAGFDAGHALAARLVAAYTEQHGPPTNGYACARLRALVAGFIADQPHES
jgi:hypothetical protein